ncbi:hypothetical protein GW915_10890 [bacterium]|nr:hypothetical protein [bacterium]
MSYRPYLVPALSFFFLMLAVAGFPAFHSLLEQDSVLYASIARNIVRTGELFELYGQQVDFPTFFEHPHLGFWLSALSMRIFGFSDMAARLPNLFYLWALFLLVFVSVQELSNRWSAYCCVFFLATMSYFTRWFISPSLDAGCLFWGLFCFYFLWKMHFKTAGLCLFLSFLYKGLTVLGFFPVIGVILLLRPRRLSNLLAFSAGVIFPLSLFGLALYSSKVPHFFEIYWDRQVTSRFGLGVQWRNFLNSDFWTLLFKDSNYFLPFVFVLPFLKGVEWRLKFVPLLGFTSFAFMYLSKNRYGENIWVTLLPWVAISAGLVFGYLFEKLKALEKLKLQKVSLIVCLFAALVSCGVVATKGPKKLWSSLRYVQSIKSEQEVTNLYFDSSTLPNNFLVLSAWTWYADVFSEYAYLEGKDFSAPEAQSGYVYILHEGSSARRKELERKNWCRVQDFRDEEKMEVFTSCPNS